MNYSDDEHDAARRELFSRFDDELLITMAAARFIELLSDDPVSINIFSELIERRGVDVHSDNHDDYRVAAEVQLDVVARYAGVMGLVAEGKVLDENLVENDEDFHYWQQELEDGEE